MVQRPGMTTQGINDLLQDPLAEMAPHRFWDEAGSRWAGSVTPPHR
jgi:hypothetical protein